MEVLLLLLIPVTILVWSVKKFKPELWQKLISLISKN